MLFLGIDVGTSACKALLVDERGCRRAFARVPYEPDPSFTLPPDNLIPSSGRSEADPEIWWRAAQAAVGECLTGSGEPPAAIGLTGATLVPILVDAAGKPLRPAMLWDDARAVAETDELRERVAPEELRQALGGDLPLSPSWPLPRLLWLRRHEPEVLEQTASVLQPKDYVRLRLTGEIASDSRSCLGLVNLLTGEPPLDLLATLGLSPGVVPPILPPEAPAGQVRTVLEISELPAGLPVAVGTADFPAALLGLGVNRLGAMFHVAGTTDHLGVLTPRRLPDSPTHPLLWTPDEEAGTLYGVISSGGGAWSWFCEAFELEPATAIAEAAAVPPGAEGLLFLPYLRGERTPLWNPRARGVFLGLTAQHRRAHLARAVLEGVAFALRRVLELAQASCSDEGREASEERWVRAGGAPAGPSPHGGPGLWNEIKASVWGRPLAVMAETEVSALGAAMLAARAAGAFADRRQAVDAMVRIAAICEPRQEESRAYDEAYRNYRSLDTAVAPLFTG
jgi:xylulokinase